MVSKKKTIEEVLEESDKDIGPQDTTSNLPPSNSSINSEYVEGLDSYEFIWNKNHPLRRAYIKLKRELYSKYDCSSNENVDLKMLVDEVLILKTQLNGVGRMIRDGSGPKNLAYRVSKHQTKIVEIMGELMKYTRKMPEKAIKKTMIDNGKKLATDMKTKIPEHKRAQLSRLIKEHLNSKYMIEDGSEPAFDDPIEEEVDD